MVQLFRVGALQLAFDRSVLAARLLCLLHDLKEQPALLGRPESTGLGKAIVAKRTVEGPRRASASTVYAAPPDSDLHVRLVPVTTIARRHDLSPMSYAIPGSVGLLSRVAQKQQNVEETTASADPF